MAERVGPDAERRWRLFLWLCAALRGDPVEWPADPAETQPLLALAGEHFITPTLAHALSGRADLPAAVRDYLNSVALLNRERNDLFLHAVERAAACLADAGITAVFLKGAAALADGLYPDPGCRFLGDIDVLVPPDAAHEASRALVRIGFSDIDVPERRWVTPRYHHLPLQRHVDSGVGIEVHQQVFHPVAQHLLTGDAVLRTARAARLRQSVLVPSPRLRALHAILHDQLGFNWRRRQCGLRMLCDVARLFARDDAGAELADLPDDVPRSARQIVDHGLALTGLLGAPVDQDRIRGACTRLRIGLERAGYGVTDHLAEGLVHLRVQPLAVLNLIDPVRWPWRMARLRRLVRR